MNLKKSESIYSKIHKFKLENFQSWQKSIRNCNFCPIMPVPKNKNHTCPIIHVVLWVPYHCNGTHGTRWNNMYNDGTDGYNIFYFMGRVGRYKNFYLGFLGRAGQDDLFFWDGHDGKKIHFKIDKQFFLGISRLLIMIRDFGWSRLVDPPKTSNW
jgi:hypothetical protein